MELQLQLQWAKAREEAAAAPPQRLVTSLKKAGAQGQQRSTPNRYRCFCGLAVDAA